MGFGFLIIWVKAVVWRSIVHVWLQLLSGIFITDGELIKVVRGLWVYMHMSGDTYISMGDPIEYKEEKENKRKLYSYHFIFHGTVSWKD